MADEQATSPDEERRRPSRRAVQIVRTTTEPALRFGPDDTGPLPHWTEPPTGEVPKILADEPPRRRRRLVELLGPGPGLARRPERGRQRRPRPHAADRGPAARRSRRRWRPVRHRRDLAARRASDDSDDATARPASRRGSRRSAPGGEAPSPPPRPSRAPTTAAARRHGRPGPADGHRRRLRPRRAVPAAAELRRALRRRCWSPSPWPWPASSSSTRSASKGYQPAHVHRPRRRRRRCPWPPTGSASTALPLVVRPRRSWPPSIWFMASGSVDSGPLPNTAITMLGVVYIGLLGSFAALILRFPNNGARAFCWPRSSASWPTTSARCSSGRAPGRTPLAAWISPNKTVEGLVGGALAHDHRPGRASSIADRSTRGSRAAGSSCWPSRWSIVIIAPLGDLTESMFKRNLDIKDFGTLLPGHGGVLDRFDGFCSPCPRPTTCRIVLEPWVT